LCFQTLNDMSKKHRGRIQAQGNGLEKSEAWSQDEPLSKNDGLGLLEKLKLKLTKQEFKVREKQFESAKKYIENVEGGLDAVKKKTFRNRKTRNVRVDIEILAGRAFVTFWPFIILLFIYFLLKKS